MLDAPCHKVAEIVDGTLYISSRPATLQTFASSRLLGILGESFLYNHDDPGGWWILPEPEIHLGEDVVVPNITEWRHGRMPEFPMVDFFTQAPDFACEVLSPSTRKLDLGGKRSVYAREGVRYLWLVDPDAQLLEAFELRDEEWMLIGSLYDDVQVSLSPFESIRFALSDLWPPRIVH